MTVYSHTRLGTYESCPLRYRFRYIDKIPPEIDYIGSFMGKRVHETLEELHTSMKECDLSEVHAYFEELWRERWRPNIRILKEGLDAEYYRKIGKGCITDYYNRHIPFHRGEDRGIELKMNIRIGKHTLVGIVDRLTLVKEGGKEVYEIHDYKTSSRLPSRKSVDNGRQLGLYEIGVRQMFPDADEVELVWHYLRHDKELRSGRTPEQLEGLKAEVRELVATIEKTREFRPRPTTLCRWCPYQYLCPRRKDRITPADLPPSRIRESLGRIEERLGEFDGDNHEYGVLLEIRRRYEGLLREARKG